MYLYIWKNGDSAIVNENLTLADLLGVKVELLAIYKYVDTKGFYRLVIKDKLIWEKVKESRVAICNNVRLHNTGGKDGMGL